MFLVEWFLEKTTSTTSRGKSCWTWRWVLSSKWPTQWKLPYRAPGPRHCSTWIAALGMAFTIGLYMEKPPKMGPSSSIFVDRIFHEKKQAFWGYPYFWKIRENPICLDSSLDMFILTSHQQKYVAGSLRFLCRFPEIIWRFHWCLPGDHQIFTILTFQSWLEGNVQENHLQLLRCD